MGWELTNIRTAHNRIVYASPPKGGSGSEKPQSGYALYAVFSPPHFWGCEELLRNSSQPQKRRIQLLRYVP
jgi:hypothetical protein